MWVKSVSITIHALVVFKYLSTAFGILSFELEVQLPWEARFEFICQPSILEVWEDEASDIAAELDHCQVTWHLLFDPLVLYFDCDYFPCLP